MTGRRAAASLLALALLAGAPPAARAEALRVTATPDRTVVVRGEPVMVTVTAESNGFVPASIEIPRAPGLTIERAGTSQNIVMAAGSIVRTDVALFRVTSPLLGKYTIPPFTAALGGKRLETSSITFEVVASLPPSPSSPGAPAGSPEGAPLFARFLVDKRHVYWNEQIVGRMQVFARAPLEDEPAWESPEAPGFWVEPLGASRHDRVTVEGHPYERYERAVAYFPTRSGRLTLGPARARVRVVRQDQPAFDPFAGLFVAPTAEVVEVPLEAAPVDVTVDPLPAGAPPEFRGAVGSLSLDVRVDRRRVRAGEPVTIGTSIQGEGNLASAADPEILVVPAFPSYAAGSRTDLDRSGGRVRGVRRRETAFIPDHPGSLTVMPVVFSWFDPEAGRYRVQRSDSVFVRVDAPAGGASGGAGLARSATGKPAPARPGRGPSGDLSGAPSPAGSLLGIASLLAYAGLGIGVVATRRAAKDPRRRRHALLADAVARIEAASGSGAAPRDAEGIASALRDAAGVRFGADIEGRSRRELLERLRTAGVPLEEIARLGDLLARLELAAFAPGPPEAARALGTEAAALAARWRDECRP